MTFDPEFDCVFTVNDDGTVNTEVNDIYAPTVYNDSTDDIYIDDDAWEALTGWSNQDSYRGACLHSSEQFKGSLANYILDNPGTYVLTVVYPEDDGPCCIAYVTSGGRDCVPDCEGPVGGPDGWVVLKLKKNYSRRTRFPDPMDI